VRALERIARHAHVCVYAGALVDTETAEARTRRSALNDAYIFDVSRTPKGGYAIDGFAQRGVGSFINFSCAPNLRAAAFRTQSGMTLIAFKASRDIEQIDDPLEPGDASPRDADEGIPALNNSCACGAARCLGRF
jgi:SET domain-containing protein